MYASAPCRMTSASPMGGSEHCGLFMARWPCKRAVLAGRGT